MMVYVSEEVLNGLSISGCVNRRHDDRGFCHGFLKRVFFMFSTQYHRSVHRRESFNDGAAKALGMGKIKYKCPRHLFWHNKDNTSSASDSGAYVDRKSLL